MNSEASPPEKGEPEPEILLICVEKKHYMAEGEEYLSELLLVDGTFPTPIRCVKFQDAFEFGRITDGTVNLSDLWSINPEIINRLRKDGHLIEMNAASD